MKASLFFKRLTVISLPMLQKKLVTKKGKKVEVTNKQLDHKWLLLYERNYDNIYNLKEGYEVPYLKEATQTFITRLGSKSNVKDMAEAFRTVELGWKELIQSFPRSSSTRLDLEAT